jgi:hypothetical protein
MNIIEGDQNMPNNITPEIVEQIFYVDGSLRDIYIIEANLNDWQTFLNWVESTEYEVNLYIDGEEEPFENCKASRLFEVKKRHKLLLSISFKGVLINCHFFSEDEMEFDIDPKQVKGIVEAGVVIKFMKKLSSIFCKESFLTLENSPEYPLVTVNPDGIVRII